MKKSTIAITVAATTLMVSQPSAWAGNAVSSKSPTQPTAAKIAALSRAETRAMLANIERTERPEPKMGAMCYRMALPPERAEYVCPTCGERTLYGRELSRFIERELARCRSLLRRIPGHEAMSLDESSLCRKCRPNASAHELILTIRFDDGKTNVVHGVTADDLRLLAGALSGTLTGETSNEGREPLKDSLPRLRELLGEKVAK